MISHIFRNAHQALPEMMDMLLKQAPVRPSRTGDVATFLMPACIELQCPMERVVFWPERDANPYFHFMEGLWMLAGRADVGFLAQFERSTLDLADEDGNLHGAFGHRWRNLNQVQVIAEALRIDATCRRQVLQIWDSNYDLDAPSIRDIPNVTSVYFQRNIVDPTGPLDMMINSRSADLVWDALGRNPVHFGMLQEYMAFLIGCPVGRYYHSIFNLHAHTDGLKATSIQELAEFSTADHVMRGMQDPYVSEDEDFKPYPMFNTPIHVWREDLGIFLETNGGTIGFKDRFFKKVAVPMIQSNTHLLEGDRHMAIQRARDIEAEDLRKACVEWLERRKR